MKLNKRFFYGVLTAVALLAAGCSKDNTDPVPDPGTGEQLVENPKVRAVVRTMMSEAARTESTLNGVAVWQEGYASSGECPRALTMTHGDRCGRLPRRSPQWLSG